MASKLEAARLATTGGENVIIAYGRRPMFCPASSPERTSARYFLAQGQTVAARKRWIGLTVKPRGRLLLDAGAREAIEKKGKSLLAIGVVGAEGDFIKGDVVALSDSEDREFARGLTNYSAEDIRRIKGLKTNQIAQVLRTSSLRRDHPPRQHGGNQPKEVKNED